jgi:signal transduction histidine kinase
MIARDHVLNFKNVRAAEYTRKIDNVIIDALAEINEYEFSRHIKDSLKYRYWADIRSDKERHLRFYPVNENGKRKIMQQIVAHRYPDFYSETKEKEPFRYDDYLPMFVAGQDIIMEIMGDVHFYSLFDTIASHLAAMPTYTHEELVAIYTILKKQLQDNNISTNVEYCTYIPAFNKFVLCNKCNLLDVMTKGNLYNFEIYNENVGLNAFFLIYFKEEASYLSAYDNFTILFTWGTVVLIYAMFFYLLYTSKKIREMAELRNEFINNISHEFKTPISTIALTAEGLMDQDIVSNENIRRNYVQAIQTEIKRLENMVGTILESALISRKSFLLRQDKNNIAINDCIETAIKEVLVFLHEKNGVIEVNYSAVRIIAYIDPDQMVMVIKNILENAIKYTIHRPPRIEITTINKGKYIVISVKDNGMGISKRQQKKIFEKLYRVPTGNIHDVKGYGLGLYNANTIIKSYHGKITVESELNKGSIFKIWIPVSTKIVTN